MNAPLNGVPSTLTEALAKLDEYYAKKPTPEEWSQIWPPILFNAKLPPTHEDLVIDRLVALNIGKIRTLKTELKQFREEQEQQRQIAEGGLAGARADKYTTLVRILREDRTLLAQPPRFNQMTRTWLASSAARD